MITSTCINNYCVFASQLIFAWKFAFWARAKIIEHAIAPIFQTEMWHFRLKCQQGLKLITWSSCQHIKMRLQWMEGMLVGRGVLNIIFSPPTFILLCHHCKWKKTHLIRVNVELLLSSGQLLGSWVIFRTKTFLATRKYSSCFTQQTWIIYRYISIIYMLLLGGQSTLIKKCTGKYRDRTFDIHLLFNPVDQ